MVIESERELAATPATGVYTGNESLAPVVERSHGKHSLYFFVRVRSFFLSAVIAFILSGMLWHSASAQKPGSKPAEGGSRKVPLDELPKHASTDTVGIVNGEVIEYGDFMSIMAGYLKTFVTRSKDNVVSDSLYTVIVDSSWDRAVTDIITEQEIMKRHLAMTAGEIEDSLQQNPPDYLRKQFTDSLGTFHGDIMRRALTDPRNDTIAAVVMDDERVRLESERLLGSFGTKTTAAAERQKAYDAWLQRAKKKARIIDKRIRFGLY